MQARGQIFFSNSSWPAGKAAAKKRAEKEKKKQEEDAESRERSDMAGGREQKKEEEGPDSEKFINQLAEKLKPEKSDKEKMEELLNKSARVLFKASTVFPFDLFPDKLIIDEIKISIVYRHFFSSEQVYSVSIKDIDNVSVEVIPFLATLKIIDNRYKDNPIIIKNLRRKAATRARRIIEGLILGRDQKIDFSKLEGPDLVKKIEELGEAKGVA